MPANSGNPKPVGLKGEKIWRQAITMALADMDGKGAANRGKTLRKLAKRMIEDGLSGDTASIKEIGDRLDGKTTQALQHSGGVTMEHIERLIVSSSDTDS